MTGYMPTPADIENVEKAAAAIDTNALSIRLSSTKPPQHEEWVELADWALYTELKEQAHEMYALAERLQVALHSVQSHLPLEAKR